MSVLTLRSPNPDLSFIIQKNPNSVLETKKPYSRAIRRGMAYGWFMKDGSYRLWFKDHPHEVSYPMDEANPEFEYLDRTRYAHPYLMNSLVNDCFNTALKKRDEKDVDQGDFETVLETTVEIRSKSMVKHLTSQFTDLEKGRALTLKPIGGDAYVIQICGRSVYQVLNTAIVASVLMCTADPTIYVDLRGDRIDKYARCLHASDAPYFIRYLFNRNVFSNLDTFRKNKDQLDTPTMDFAFGDTHRQRMDYVFPYLKNKTRRAAKIHEIGIGEGKYTVTLAGIYDDVVGWEPEEELREKVVGKLTARELVENFTVNEGLTSEFVEQNPLEFKDTDILVTEVFEHIEKDEATKLLKALLSTSFNRIIVTVPNVTFNELYKLDQPFRHDDHKWEPTINEFFAWVTQAWESVGGDVKDIKFKTVGDKVTFLDGSIQTPSIGFSIDRADIDS